MPPLSPRTGRQRKSGSDDDADGNTAPRGMGSTPPGSCRSCSIGCLVLAAAHPAGLPYLIFAALAVIAGFLIRFNWRLIEQPVRLSLLLAATVPEKLRLNRYRDA